jgi:hypothetical protein
MNRLPRPKIHANNAEKVRAYQQRKREQRAVSAEVARRLMLVENPNQTPVSDIWNHLTEEQKEALRRLASSQDAVTNLKKEAA